ncbi:MAG: TOBE domain-containing protein, partial [Armatimonadota bacterium]|nr:TOBE domain-containing protein [Armatimonadota bacterium]
VRLLPVAAVQQPALRGRIAATAFLGSLTRYWVTSDGNEWVVDVPAPGHETLRGEVALLLPSERIHVLTE